MTEGLIRAYAWSTDDPARAAVFAEGPHCAAVQHALNVLDDAPEMLLLCERASSRPSTAAPSMGLLTGKHRGGSTAGGWATSAAARPPGCADSATAAAPTRVAGPRRRAPGRPHRRRPHLAQGALAWLWARSPRTVPIPGFRSVAQAEENAGAIDKGPLTEGELAEVERILRR